MQQTQYIRDPGGTLIAMRTNDNNTGWADHYYTTDRLGSTLILTTNTGTVEATYTYDTWGNLTTPAPAAGTIAARNPYRYAAGYTDTTGLTKFGTRYYNPTLGTWTQTDPASAGTNYYAYASDNPLTNADPQGTWDWPADDSEFSQNDGFDYSQLFGQATGDGLVGGGVGAIAGLAEPEGGPLAGFVGGFQVGFSIGLGTELIAQTVPSSDAEDVRAAGDVSHLGSALPDLFGDS